MPGDDLIARRRRRKATATRPTSTLEEAFALVADAWLVHPNIVGLTLAKKIVGGAMTDEDAVVFQVSRKLESRPDILLIGSKPVPASLEICGQRFSTDVIEGGYEPSAALPYPDMSPRDRHSHLCPGISVGRADVPGDAGTSTAIVVHRPTGRLSVLSCHHVICRRSNSDSPLVLQPGELDGGRVPGDVVARLGHGIRDGKVDAAIAAIERRAVDLPVAGLGIPITQIGMPSPGNLLVMAGRTSGVNYGVVRSQLCRVLMRYKDGPSKFITGFDIEFVNGGRSGPGDSGAPWLLVDPASRQPTGTLVGIHVGFALNGRGAFACFAPAVFEQLEIELAQPAHMARMAPPVAARLPAATIQDRAKVIARRGLVLRGGAGSHHARLDLLPYATPVHRLGTSGDWTKVDLLGDGRADGFVYSDFLHSEDEDVDPFHLA